MHKFKVGDRAVRSVSNHPTSVFDVGDTGTVIDATDHATYYVRADKTGNVYHCREEYLEKAYSKPTKYNMLVPPSPRPTLTLRTTSVEINGHTINVETFGSVNSEEVLIDVDPKISRWSEKSLRETAELFIEIADALKEVNG